MSKKNRPNKKTAPTAPAQAAAPQPVMQGNCLATFMSEVQQLGNEVMARRQTERDVAEYLASKNLVEDFNTWRKAKYEPAPLSQ